MITDYNYNRSDCFLYSLKQLQEREKYENEEIRQPMTSFVVTWVIKTNNFANTSAEVIIFRKRAPECIMFECFAKKF